MLLRIFHIVSKEEETLRRIAFNVARRLGLSPKKAGILWDGVALRVLAEVWLADRYWPTEKPSLNYRSVQGNYVVEHWVWGGQEILAVVDRNTFKAIVLVWDAFD